MSVFVSYRREDSAGHAGRLSEHLSDVFGPENVFLDVQDIAPGQDFTEAIEKTVSGCQAVVVVIGPRWVEAMKKRGDAEDFVRLEVSAALQRQATVIPVLVGGAIMPAAADLPKSLAALSRRQAVEIRDGRFDDDVKVLVNALQKILGVPAVTGARRRWILWLLAAVCVAVIAGMILWKQREGPVTIGTPAAEAPKRSPERFDISGTWIAELQKPGQRVFRVKLNLAGSGGRIIGNVEYPTGDAAIQAGKLEGSSLSFSTTHTPNFASQPATIEWTGVVEGSEIRFTVANEDGIAKGIARRNQ